MMLVASARTSAGVMGIVEDVEMFEVDACGMFGEILDIGNND